MLARCSQRRIQAVRAGGEAWQPFGTVMSRIS